MAKKYTSKEVSLGQNEIMRLKQLKNKYKKPNGIENSFHQQSKSK